MKKLILITSLFINIVTYSQENKTVTLVVSGQGTTQEEAKQIALRSAIEQAFGTFISSKSEILNDELVKDEIVSVANGNIQKFEVISEVKIPYDGYATTIKATVSVTKLTSFVESKGFEVEFKGGLFSANIQMQELYEKNEIKAVTNLIVILTNLSKSSFDYSISASNPSKNNDKWKVPLKVSVLANENFKKIPVLLEKTLNNLALSEAEVENYVTLEKKVHPVTLGVSKKINGRYFLRKKESVRLIIDFIFNLQREIVDFEINSGFEKFTIYDKVGLSQIRIKIDHTKRSKERFESYNFIAMLGGIGGCSAFPRIVRLFGAAAPFGRGQSNFELTAYGNWSTFYKKTSDRNDFFNMEKIRIGCGNNGNYLDKTSYKEFIGLKKLITITNNSPYNEVDNLAGFIISFSGINYKLPIFTFEFDDIKSLEELKKIKKYTITKKY
jgi:hypothetical protein